MAEFFFWLEAPRLTKEALEHNLLILSIAFINVFFSILCWLDDHHTWSTMPDFLVSPQITAFQSFSSLTFSRKLVLTAVTALDRMQKFLAWFSSERGLVWGKYLQKLELLWNSILMLYRLQIFWIWCKIDSLWQFSNCCPQPSIVVIFKSASNADYILLVCVWVITYEFCSML